MFRRALLLLGILGLIGIGYLLLKNPREPALRPTATAPVATAAAKTVDPVQSPPPLAENKAVHTETPPSASPPPKRRPGPVRIRVGQEIPELFPHQAERDAIQALVSKYDARQIPAIAGYLAHEDATVREAARLGLIQLGYSEGIPYLKAALAKASAKEAAQLREDIEFLALPTAEIR